MEGKANVIVFCIKCSLFAQEDGTWSPQKQEMADDCVINNGLCPQCIKLAYPKNSKKDSPGTPE